MSKLTENPEKVVPKRVLLIAILLTIIIVVLTVFLPISLWWTLVFFWLGTVANMISFHLIVKNADRMIAKKVTGEKVVMIPNLMMRYGLYTAVLVGAWFIGGLVPAAFAFVGIQLSQIAIKLDAFVG